MTRPDPSRVLRRSVLPRVCGALAQCAALLLALGPALAQGSLDARYEATLAGIPVGKGVWQIAIGEDHYAAEARGGSSGLLKAFSGGEGTGSAQGRILNGQLSPLSYSATTLTSKKFESIRMALIAGAVKDFAIDPTPPVDADRIPITEAHRRGVFDPMTGSFMRVPGTGDPVSAEACRTTTPVFDGRMRYDLRFEFKRMEAVKAQKGYQGPAVVCAVYFVPIAGFIPDRAAIKYLIAQRNMEVWLAPIAGTRVLAPFRLSVPTPIGTAVLEATQFITTAAPPRTVSKSQ